MKWTEWLATRRKLLDDWWTVSGKDAAAGMVGLHVFNAECMQNDGDQRRQWSWRCTEKRTSATISFDWLMQQTTHSLFVYNFFHSRNKTKEKYTTDRTRVHACVVKSEEMKTLDIMKRYEMRMGNSIMKWSWFWVPVKLEQLCAYFFSDITWSMRFNIVWPQQLLSSHRNWVEREKS
jgi:hypothetical protein